MNALQRLELLSEHAELVQAIPTLKAMAKLDSLERLSEIVELLGGVQKDVNSFIDDVLTQNDPSGELELFPVSQKEVDIAKQYGLDIEGFMHVLDAQSLKHALKRHRNDSENPNNNQRNLTVDDLKRIPEVLKNFDDLQVQKRGNNRSSLVYKKTFDDGRIECVERVIETSNKKNPRLVTKTAWVVSETGVISPSPSQVYTPDRQEPTSVLIAPAVKQSIDETPETLGSQAKGSVPQTPETLSAQNRTPGAIPLDENIPNTQTNVNSGALSQAFYDEFMLKNEMGELVFADDEFVDDVDIEMHEKALVDGKTYAFGRALIAIDTICQKQQWRVAFNDFNHTLNHDSLFDSLADDYDVVAQLAKDDKIVRAGVNKDGYIVVYAGTIGNQIINGKAKYDNPKQVSELISLGFETDFDVEMPTKSEPEKSPDPQQENTMNEQENAPDEVEKGDFYEIYQLTQDDIDSERFGKLPSFVGTGEYFTKFYHLKAQGVNADDYLTMTHSRLNGLKDWIAMQQKSIQKNPFKDKEWKNKDGKGKGRIIVLKGGVTTDMAMYGVVYENGEIVKIGNSLTAVNNFIEQDDLTQVERLTQEKAEKEAQKAQQEAERLARESVYERQQEILGQKAELIEDEVMPAFEDVKLYDKRGNKFEAVMRLAEQSQNAKALGFENNKALIEHLAKQGYEFVKENEYSDDYVPMEYRSKFERSGGNYGSISSHYYAKLNDKSYEITEAEYHYGWHIRGKLNRGEMAMNASKNPNYTQSDIDYLQSIINGTLDLETVDMDKMIEIGEKDEHDPMYEQALQVVSDYLDKLTSV